MLRNALLLSGGLLVLMLGIAWFTADPTSREQPSVDQVAGLFDRIAFSGFGEQGPSGQGPVLRRWTQPVRIALIGQPQDEQAAAGWSDGVEALVSTWDTLRGVEASVVATAPYEPGSDALQAARDAANLVITTIPPDALADLVDSGALPRDAANSLLDAREGCAVVGADAAVLANVSILLRGNLGEGRRNTCLGEGLAMAFGANIEAKNTADVFRVRPDGIRFHPLGRLAVELIYDPALTPGMPRAAALDAARRVLAERGLKSDG